MEVSDAANELRKTPENKDEQKPVFHNGLQVVAPTKDWVQKPKDEKVAFGKTVLNSQNNQN